MPRNTYRSRQKRQTTQPSTLKPNISSGPKPLQCDQCYFGTAYKSVMEMHKKTHIKTKPYECNQCLFSTAHEDEWQNHVKFHSISKLLGCRFCNYTTTQENELWAHELTHSTNKPLRCEQCDFTTAFQSVLDMHSKIHNSIPLFECNLCDFTTFVRAELINHKKIHPPGKPYKCIHCDYTSDRKSSVKLHQTVHSAIRQYKCNQCSFSSARKSNLTKHKFIHTNLKPHKCHHCKFASAYKGSLQLHIKTLHKGAKFYNCAQCTLILQRRPKAKDKVPSAKKPVKRQPPRKPKPVARTPKKVQQHIIPNNTINQDSSQGTHAGHPGPEIHMNPHHQVPETSKGHHHGLDLHMNHSMIPPQGDLRDRGDFMHQAPRKPTTPLRIPKVPQNETGSIVCNPQRPVCTVSDCAAANNVNNNQAAYYANHMQSQQGMPYQIWHHGSNGISTWQCF